MRTSVILFLAGTLALAGASHAQRTMYKWVDKNGVVQYGDRIPPEYANTDRNVLNSQGVRVGFEHEATPEERANQERLAAEAEAQRQTKLEAARRDRMLLDTYVSVTEIEDLRDRRLELLESQIKVTELYLGNLRERLVALQAEASVYKPYTTNADAPQTPEQLQLEMTRTAASINLYEQTLVRTRQDQEALRVSFDVDIARFRELRGG
jgi:hypothetical protein